MKNKRSNDELWRLSAEFQRDQLRLLAALPQEELHALAEKTEIEPPEALRGHRFAIRRRLNEDGGVEISVIRYVEPKKIPESFLKILGIEVEVGEGGYSQSFDLLADGTISWPNIDYDPDD